MDRTRRLQTASSGHDDAVEGLGVAVIGLGAVGSSLARSLYRTKYRLLALIGRTRSAAAELAAETGTPIASDSVGDIPHEAKLLFICTREDAIAQVVAALVETRIRFEEAVVAHVSGWETAAILSPLAERGARTMSFHPLGSFPPERPDKTFDGFTIGLEGDPLAVAVGRVVALDLGAQPVEIATEAKPAYHLAASATSNYLVTLMSDVQRILASAGLPRLLTQSLAADTLLNLASMDPERALTGPIVRGDAEALESQIRTLRVVAPELLPRFSVLAGGTIDLALTSGRLTHDQSTELRRILEAAGAS